MGHPEPISVSGVTYTKFGTRDDVLGLQGKWDPKKYTVEDFGTGFVRSKNGATLSLESSFAANIEKNVMQTSILGTEWWGVSRSFRQLKKPGYSAKSLEP